GATTEDLTGLSNGTYTITITDNNGCATTTSVTVTEPDALSTSVSNTDVLCNGDIDGTADLTVAGGTTPYTYAWSNGATTEDLTELTAGTYNVTITDDNGCTATESVTISEPTAIVASSNSTDVSCNGGSN
ncbi:SprB repeat-containing protein, partial [Neptunitalea chrysea]|uniref:SprB repeat-containing protein n=1 Tax=Neptunitalea chrysea TaxID=1647581 RepID=UPI002492593B